MMTHKVTDFALSPGSGEAGRPAKVRTNHFVVSIPTGNVHQYDIDITPEKTPVKLFLPIWKALLIQESQGIFQGTKAAFDGRKIAFSFTELKLGRESVSVNVLLNENGEGRPGTKFTVKIKKVGEINMKELDLFSRGKAQQSNNCLTAIQALDVLFGSKPSMDYRSFGRSFYFPEGKSSIHGGVEIWPGYFQSIRPGQGKMYLNVDVSFMAFYEPGPLVEHSVKVLGLRSIDELRRGLTPGHIKKLEKNYKGLEVEITHRGETRRRYVIKGISLTSCDKSMFEKDGKNISVSAYFNKEHNLRLAYPFLPCIVTRKDIMFPMEVCHIVPGQRYTKKHTEIQTADMIKITCQKPHIRANKIKEGIQMLQFKSNEYLQNAKVTVQPEMTVVKSRVLPTPHISYGKGSKEATFAPEGGAWNLIGKKLSKGTQLSSWSVVNFANRVNDASLQRYIREMCQTFIDMGLNVTKRDPPITNADPQGNVEKILKEAWLKAGNAAKAQPQLIMCILPSKSVPLYAEIKRVTDTVIGVTSQCMQSKHVPDPKKQYCANVCLKVNQKLGGKNWTLPPAQIPFITQRPTIVFGADVSHPGAGDTTRPSTAAVTASTDPTASEYFGLSRAQDHRLEMIKDLGIMVKECLKLFYQNCGNKPERILFYRDGVSEGQFAAVLASEISAIKDACRSLDRNYNPTITFVVAQKRHHTRFFPMDKKDTDRSGNCLPGTVVDTTITHPTEFNFYLQSHAGLQGTSRPTHYHVLYDENKFTADSLQELTYRLCYIYGRATRSVSLVPPVYYADILAGRARFHRKGENWSDTEATSESLDSDQILSSYAPLKPELQKVMYYI